MFDVVDSVKGEARSTSAVVAAVKICGDISDSVLPVVADASGVAAGRSEGFVKPFGSGAPSAMGAIIGMGAINKAARAEASASSTSPVFNCGGAGAVSSSANLNSSVFGSVEALDSARSNSFDLFPRLTGDENKKSGVTMGTLGGIVRRMANGKWRIAYSELQMAYCK